MPNILAVIPARGGSTGVYKKNIKYLAGKPLIFYAIQAALNSKVIDRLIVSTDDDEIARIAQQFGAEVLIRPKKLASNTTLTEPVLSHVLSEVNKQGYNPDFICLIQCTSLFLTSEIIQQAVSKVTNSNYDSSITVFRPHGYEFKWRQEKDQWIPEHDVNNRPRRQDLPIIYHENGAFYITRTDLFKSTLNRFGGKKARVCGVEMSEENSLQIDNHYDFWLAEQLMRKRLLKPDFSKIKILFLDFDGVLTTNSVIVNSIKGAESVVCNRSDSLGLELLQKKDFKVCVISKEKNKIVQLRCHKLKIKCLQGVDNKKQAMLSELKKNRLTLNESCYIGNDVNDIECLKEAGVAVAPADCHPDIKPFVDLITDKKGGEGCVREVTDHILALQL